MSDVRYYRELFDYLSAESLPTEPEPAVAFGRADPLVAQRLGDLIIPGLAEIAVITGGIGKDSGDIVAQGYDSEADYVSDQLTSDARRRGYADSLPTVILDRKATNGGENARFSLDLLAQAGLPGEFTPITTLTAVAHATSARRLAETLKHEAQKRVGEQPSVVVHHVSTRHLFDPSNRHDQDEAVAELLRLVEWPAKDFIGPQPDLPANLVDFAYGQRAHAPAAPSPLASAVLHAMPRRLRARVMQSVSRRQ